MNKKYLGLGLMGLFAMSLVFAAVVSHYGSVEQDITVTLPISVDGNEPQLLEGYAGQQFIGEDITISNDAPFDVEVSVSNDAPEGIDVEYVGTLELSKKVVDFGVTPWATIGDPIAVEYTVVGNELSVNVEIPIEGYELVYYKDNSDRFANPATAIAIADVVGNLPYEEDGNAGEYDMCDVEGYTTCHGAKIWYIPSGAVNEGVIDWGQASEFYFETNLIQYNAGGELTMYPESGLTVTPIYNVDSLFEGEETVTTLVE